ncbi:MAG: IS1380 family transposase [Phycisphaerae bacterium]|nr:IS1380 family transposase [Phycisphaerae bacterium]
MTTECNQKSFSFQSLGQREVVARFDGGKITSDAGGVLLREVERTTEIIQGFSECFTDHRDQERIEHTVNELVAQRVYGLALGYEDLNDHDELRHDPFLAVLVGKKDPLGQDRVCLEDRGKALAGKSTLNRLELTPVRATAKNRYKKITLNRQAVQSFFTEVFLQSYDQPPERIVLDLDATDDLIHGHQSGRFYHGYYKNYCYLPLYIFCGEHLLCARLRPADIDASAGSVKELERIVGEIRRQWPDVKIVIRGDSGFCREAIMVWCEANDVDFVLGLAKNNRLIAEIADELEQAEQLFEKKSQAARVYKDFCYQTLDSWSQPRRVVGKAEHMAKGANPRFVVTSLSADEFDAQTLYEKEYCARGDMENRIKEQQLYLFADRTSAATMRANELRLWFSSVAYTLMVALRRLGLSGTELAKAQCGTIRVKLLKIGAQIRVTVRKVWISLSESCPYQGIFARVYARLCGVSPLSPRC